MVATFIFSVILAVFSFYSNVYQFAGAKQKAPDYIQIYRSGSALGQMDQFDAVGPHTHGIRTLLIFKNMQSDNTQSFQTDFIFKF